MESMSAPAGGALPPDLMLSHAGSIRALALSILGDEHAAEDVLQETWLRALNKPPPRHDSIGGWLRRVAEGIAISRLRSEGRRRNRETQWVEDRDCSHTSYDATERAEVLRAVVDEVLALDEPYREAVMRRYFEGLPPREIATATDSTVATVNSRLQRAQSKLRERLDRRLSDRCGGMNGALLALVGWPEEVLAASGAGIFTKAVAWKLAIGAVGAVAIVALALWVRRESDVARPVERAPVAVAPAAIERGELLDVQRGSVERTAAAIDIESTPITVGTPLPKPQPAEFAFDLAIEAIDAQGRAVQECRVWLGPEPGPLALVGSTAWDGVLRLAWRGDEPEVALVVRAALAGSGSTPLRRVLVRADGERMVRLLLDGPSANENGVPLLGDLPAVGQNFTPRPRRDEGRLLLDSAGNALFEDPWLVRGVEVSTHASGFAALTLIEPKMSYELGAADAMNPDAPTSRVDVRVVDTAGRPVAGAMVSLSTGTTLGSFTNVTYTDAFGVASTPRAPVGPARVTVAAPFTPYPIAWQRFDTQAGTQRTIEVVLPSDPIARVRLVDGDGKARADWLVELRDQSGSSVGRATTDGEGRAAIAIPGDAPVRLLARADATGPGVVVEPELLARSQEQTIVAAFAPHVRSLRVVVHGEGVANSVVRVMRVDSGDALDAAPAGDVEDADGPNSHPFRARGLSHGRYRVSVGSPQRGWLDAGEVDITGGRGSEVVHVHLAAPARIEVANGDAERLRLLGRRAGMRITSVDVRCDEGKAVTAAPGALELLVERPEMPPTLRSVQLTPGATTRVE